MAQHNVSVEDTLKVLVENKKYSTVKDVLITMNGPSLDKFESMLVPGGDLFINSSIIEQKATRDDINVHYVDCQYLAEHEVGNAKTQNMVMLGAAVATGLLPFSLEEIEETMKATVKPQFAELNSKALRYGG